MSRQVSPKVLDRAYTIEFNDVDFDEYISRFKQENTPDFQSGLIDRVGNLCKEINALLYKHNLHFAYRTLREIMQYMVYNVQSPEPLSEVKALDNMIMQKVLPRIRGDERLESTLVVILKLLEDRLKNDEEISVRSIERLKEMIEDLKSFGSCHFWR